MQHSNINSEIWHQFDGEINQKEKERVRKKHEKIREFKPEEEWKKAGIDYLNKEGFIETNVEKSKNEAYIIEDKKDEKKYFYPEFNDLSKNAQELVRLRWKNLFEALRTKRFYEDHLNFLNFLLKDEIQKIKQESRSAVPDIRTPIVDKLLAAIREFKRKQEDLKNISPEAYIACHLQELKKQIAYVQEGRIMETNYVLSMKEWALDKMEAGVPIFLHGHLGGGKTDFAIHTSIERMKDLWINRELKEWIQAEGKTGNVPEAEGIMREYRRIKEKYEQGIKNNDEKTMEKVRPYLIAGSKDFSLQDLYIEKTLKTENIFNGYDLQEHNQKIEEEFAKWLEKNRERLKKLSEEEQERETQNAAKRIQDLYIKKHEGYGLTVKKIEKELLQAIKEGKPIIIDEVNAIPATLLISMNDILTTRPGKTAYVPGVGQVKVREGFSIIMTGNINSSLLVDYIGVEDFNPAFLSRLIIKEYDYLPQNTDGEYDEQTEAKKNELFQVLVAFLANKDASLKLPNGSLRKIFKLAQLAKVTQRVFAGKWQESDVLKGGGDEMGNEPQLEEAVLSVRNLINVLNEWQKGAKKDLDKALWDGFISGIVSARDQNFIFAQARRFGFFAGGHWKDVSWDDMKERESLFSWDDISKKSERELLQDYQPPENYYYSPREVAQILYGQAPERLNFPDVDLEKLANGEIELDIEKILEWEKSLTESKKILRVVEQALQREGCLNHI